MTPLLHEDRYSGFKHHVKVHSFRIITVILAWVFIAAAFYEKPELLTGFQRAIQRGMEAVGDSYSASLGTSDRICLQGNRRLYLVADHPDSCLSAGGLIRDCKRLALASEK